MSAEVVPVRIFIAYSSKDLAFKEEIRRRLKPLLRVGKISIWDNHDIEAGTDWDDEIREKLTQSDLILLLLSPDALDSDYFYDVEAPIALQRHEAREAIAVGVLLRPCGLKHTPFEKLERYELLPKKGYPVTDPHWHNADAAYLTIFEEIDLLVEKVEDMRLTQALHLQHQQEYAALATQADGLVKKKKWTEAKAVLGIALAIWEEGFAPAREGLEKMWKKCGDELLAAEAADREKREEEERRQREEADHAAWEMAIETADEAAYQKYQREYPKGIHANAANIALIEIEEDKKEAARKKREDVRLQREQADHAAWGVANHVASEAAYQEYLRKYPKGIHIDTVQKALAEIETAKKEAARKKREAARLQREEADHAAWKIANEAANQVAYQKYLREYPMGLYIEAAIVALREIETAKKEAERKKREDVRLQREQADHTAWGIANEAASEVAYQKYLREYPKGLYIEAAIVALREIETAKKEAERKKREDVRLQREQADHTAWEIANEAASEAAYQEYLRRYPQGMHVNPAQTALADIEKAKKEVARKKREAARLQREEAGGIANEAVSEEIHKEYLSEYKKGIHAEATQTLLTEIEKANKEVEQKKHQEEERRQIEEADHAAWKIASETANEKAYKKYLNEHKSGLYVEAAQTILTEIEKAQKEAVEKRKRAEQDNRQREDVKRIRKQEKAERLKREEEQADKSAWDAAQKTGTVESYTRYLKAYPAGRYVKQAYRLEQEFLEMLARKERKKATQRNRTKKTLKMK